MSQRLGGASAAFLLTGEESRTDEDGTHFRKRRRNIKSGKFRTRDTHPLHSIKWPNKMVFTSYGQAPNYLDMSLALFPNGYLAIVAEESVVVKEYMLTHLQELFEDIEMYGWKSVNDYHAAWLQLLEQGWAAWGDAVKKGPTLQDHGVE